MKEKDLKESELKKAVGLRFKQFREFIEKSQAELAEELHLKKYMISNIEKGKIFPCFHLQQYLFNHYQLDLNWLYMGSGEMIITTGEKSINDHVRKITSHMDENDPKYEKYAELVRLMNIPAIENIIFAKLAEIKILASKEINALLTE